MFWKDYTGADATAEILIMLLGSFLLGALLMWLYDKFLFDCVEEDGVDDFEEEVVETKIVDSVDENREDDLKIVEGIGPKIEEILKSSGIKTWKDLSESTPEQIRDILLEVGGERYAFHDPTTWADQAKLAVEGKFEELEEYQDFLNGGRA